MTLLIDVGTVLRTTVCDLYSNLVTRPTGVAVRSAIEQQVIEIGSPVVTTIDFSQVNLLDFSCADEIVAKLLLRYSQSDDAIGGYVLFRGIQEVHRDPIEAVLEHHDLALVAWQGSRASIIGSVSGEDKRYWQIAYDRGPVASVTVANEFGVAQSHAEERLQRLATRRLLMHVDDGFVVPGVFSNLRSNET